VLSTNKIKFIKSLQQKKYRIENGLFVAEGEKIVNEALTFVPESIVGVYHTSDYHVSKNETNHEIISDKELSRISGLKSPNKCLALIRTGFQPKVSDNNTGTLVLDGIQDPGNLGTIIRTADWFGIKKIICSEDTVEFYNSKVLQATMGSIFHVEIAYTNIKEFLSAADNNIYGAVLDGKNLNENIFEEDPIIVIGNESKGISIEVRNLLTHPITIKKNGFAESLNAGVATGIILSHWRVK
jgi:TrmH family RNA methyltransferase